MGKVIDEANRKQEVRRTRKSRTFTMTDEEYQSITDLAEAKGVTRTVLLVDLVDTEAKRLK